MEQDRMDKVSVDGMGFPWDRVISEVINWPAQLCVGAELLPALLWGVQWPLMVFIDAKSGRGFPWSQESGFSIYVSK